MQRCTRSHTEPLPMFGNSKGEMSKSFKLSRRMIACKFRNCIQDNLGGQTPAEQRQTTNVIPCITTLLVQHTLIIIVHEAVGIRLSTMMLEFLRITSARAVSQSSQQGRPMYYSRVWDCKAAAVRAEGQGAGEAAPPGAVRPASQTSVGGRSVNFPGFGAAQDGDVSVPRGPH